MHWLLAQSEPPNSNFWAIPRTVGPLFSQPVFYCVLGTFIVTILAILLISRVPSNFRKVITVGITFLAGMFYVLEWVLPRARTAGGEPYTPFFGYNYQDAGPIVDSISQVLTGMLLALGVLSIFRVHFGRLFKLQRDWFYSAVLLLSLFMMLGLGFVNFSGDKRVEAQQASVDAALRLPTPPMQPEYADFARVGINSAANDLFEAKQDVAQRLYGLRKMSKTERDAALAAARGEADRFVATETAAVDVAVASGTLTEPVAAHVKDGMTAAKERGTAVQGFNLLYRRGLLAMDAAMFSLIGFFILSAAYRAFRIRSVEASILMATALVVLLMFVPIALQLTAGLDPNSFAGNFRIDSIGMWLLSTINVPAIRAIDLGLGLGLLAMALRIMLGLERGVVSE